MVDYKNAGLGMPIYPAMINCKTCNIDIPIVKTDVCGREIAMFRKNENISLELKK